MITLPPDPTAYSRALATLWNEIAPIGRNPDTGGYRRFAWTEEDRLLREWFAGAAAARGLEVTLDRAGNQWAWWGDPDAAAIAGRPGWSSAATSTRCPTAARTTGRSASSPRSRPSMCCGPRASDRRDRSAWSTSATRRARAIGVACAGSRLLTGALDADRAPRAARRRRLDDGRGHGAPPASTRSWSARIPLALHRIGTFVELHVEQGRGLVDLGAPVGVASAIWPHGRWRFDFAGEANHAGTTRLADRRDPMLDLAEAVLAARGSRRAARARSRPSARSRSSPTASTRSRRRSPRWLDARGPSAAGACAGWWTT